MSLPLDTRDTAILRRLAAGQSLKGIARDHNLSAYSLKRHARILRLKLGAKTSTEAVAIALRAHLI